MPHTCKRLPQAEDWVGDVSATGSFGERGQQGCVIRANLTIEKGSP